MKTQTTQKYIRAIENNIISIPYCNIQHLLTYTDANYYNAGVYGWNCDIYVLNNCMIVTGYRPFGNIKPKYDLCRKYDDLARDILNDHSIPWETQRDELNALLEEFVSCCLFPRCA